MKPTIRNFIQPVKRISLSAERKDAMRAALSEYAEMHPVVRPVARPRARRAPFPFIPASRALSAALVAVVIVGTTGTAAFAAESTVPGDALYSVKVHVNEPIAKALATTPLAKARVNAALAERRIDEAAVLASKGELNADTSSYLSARVEAHVADSEAAASELDAEGNDAAADTVRTDIAEGVEAHARVLAAISEDLSSASRVHADRLVAVAARVKDEESKLAARDDESVMLSVATGTHMAVAVLREHAEEARVAHTAEVLSVAAPREGAVPATAVTLKAAALLSSSTATSTATTSEASTTRAEEEIGDDARDNRHGFWAKIIAPLAPALDFSPAGDLPDPVLPESIAPPTASN